MKVISISMWILHRKYTWLLCFIAGCRRNYRLACMIPVLCTKLYATIDSYRRLSLLIYASHFTIEMGTAPWSMKDRLWCACSFPLWFTQTLSQYLALPVESTYLKPKHRNPQFKNEACRISKFHFLSLFRYRSPMQILLPFILSLNSNNRSDMVLLLLIISEVCAEK